MNERSSKKRRRQSGWLWVALVAVILALLGLILYLMFGRVTDQRTRQPVETLISTATPSPTPAPVEPGVAIPGWGSMTIPAGVTEAATSMQNPEANEGWYYLTFELRLKDTDEVLFTTGLIPPGQYCNKVTLTRPLEPGEYAAVIHVQPYRISDQSPTNNADMETVLIVK